MPLPGLAPADLRIGQSFNLDRRSNMGCGRRLDSVFMFGFVFVVFLVRFTMDFMFVLSFAQPAHDVVFCGMTCMTVVLFGYAEDGVAGGTSDPVAAG
jgi:hypothetical protein